MQERRLSNVRPTYLLVEPANDSISSRKLNIETVLKHNVLMANTADEAQTTLHVFPNVDALIVHSAVPQSSALVSWVREQYPEKYVVFLAEPSTQRCDAADVVISAHEPSEFLAALQGDYETSEASRKRADLLDDLVRTLRSPQALKRMTRSRAAPQ